MIDIVSKKIFDYCENYSSGEPKIYKKIKELTYNKEALPQMLSGKMVGNVLQLLLKLMNAKDVLELGTFTGYSALKMAEVLQGNSTVATIDISPSPIAKTVIKDNPRFTVRKKNLVIKYMPVIIIDSSLKIPIKLKYLFT